MKRFLLMALLGGALLNGAPLPMLTPAPVIDGKKGDKGWKNALKKSFKTKKGYICLGRTADRLFVCAEFKHGNIKARTENMTRQDSAVYDNDNIDFFFTSDPGKDESYYQIIANVRGTLYDHFKDRDGRPHISWDSGALARGSYGKDSCYIEMSVPLSVMECGKGKLGIAVGAFTPWNREGEALWGDYHKPDTFTVFDLPDRFPVKITKRTWAYTGGEQSSFFTLENTSAAGLKLKGDYNGRPVAFTIKGKGTYQLQCRSNLPAGKEGRNILRLFDGRREILRAVRIFTPVRLLNVTAVSDLIYEDEPLDLKISVNEKQTENVQVRCFPGKAVCSYKGEVVEVPFERIPSPWK